MFKATIRLELGDKSDDYIKVMDKSIEYKKSSVSARKDGSSVLITVEGEDQVALFASMNSVLKQLRIIGNADKKIDELE